MPDEEEEEEAWELSISDAEGEIYSINLPDAEAQRQWLQVTDIAILVTLTVSPFATVTTSVFLIDDQDVRRSTAEVHPPCSQVDHLFSLIQLHCFRFCPLSRVNWRVR